ncbi:Hypothetical predicted protein, partial [Marmota monax]
MPTHTRAATPGDVHLLMTCGCVLVTSSFSALSGYQEFPSGYLHWTPDRDVREHQARTRLPFEMLVYSHTTQSNTR